MAQINNARAVVMEAIEEYLKNLAINELSWINKALNAPEKAKTRQTTKAWNAEGSPLNMRLGTGLPFMNSHGSMIRSAVIVKEATKIDSKMLVLIGGCGWTEFDFTTIFILSLLPRNKNVWWPMANL
ncbi:unnamed protein product [Camellia sinensis]